MSFRNLLKQNKKTFKKNLLLLGISFVLFNLAFAQSTITGKVIDANNEPLIGVNVVSASNNTVGTITDFDGNYEISLTDNTKALKFSYLSYKTEVVEIDGQTEINLTMLEASETLEGVIVSARRTSENLQEVPVAVSAFSAKALETKGISDISGIANYTPNVEIDVDAPFSGSSSVLSPYIRGIGQIDFAITYEPAIGLYVDGVYYGRAMGSVLDLSDVESIEVLKGPQGTLFGRNTIGGAILVTTAKPTDEFSMSAQYTTGSFNRQDMKVGMNIPLVKKKLYLNFSAASNNRNGYVERIPYTGAQNGDLATIGNGPGFFDEVGLDDDQGNINNSTWRTKLSWFPSDKVRISTTFDYVKIRQNQNGSTLLRTIDSPTSIVGAYNNVCITGVPAPFCTLHGTDQSLANPLATPYDDRFVTGNPFTTYATGDGGTRADTWGGALNMSFDLNDNIVLKSISSYRNLASVFGEDQDMSPIDFAQISFKMPQEQFTQELQLSGRTDNLKWIAGLYYFTENGMVIDQVRPGAGIVQVYGPVDVDNQSFAGFGQATYNVTDKWSITGGLRYTAENKELASGQSDLNSFVIQAVPPTAENLPTSDPTLYFPPGRFKQDFGELTFRLGTEYKINEDLFTYFSFAQGFKSGGWTTRVTEPVKEAPTYEPERANTYEIGLKSEFNEGKLRFNAAAFLTDYNDLQVTVQQGISPFVVNAANAKIQGLELDLQFIPAKNFLVTTNFGWLDAEYLEITDEFATIQEGFKFVNAPDLSGSIAVDLTTPLKNKKANLVWHLDYAAKSEVANNAENTPLLMQPGYGLLNAFVSVENAGKNWMLKTGFTNLTNKTILVSGFDIPAVGITYGTYARPREFYVSLSYKL